MTKINLKNIPTKPGIYQFLDQQRKILYIGKAKNLKNRVQSYFQRTTELEPQKQQLVEKTSQLEYTIVSNETEAILLEASLVRKHRPPYNVLLKDDKYFQFFKITTSEFYPRVMLARRVYKDKNRYFGPYPQGANVKTVYRLLKKIFPFRTCNRLLRLDRLPMGRVCLQYHLGNCFGPCENLISQTKYREVIDQIIQFLSGHYQEIISETKAKMQQAATKKEYETAAIYRNQLQALEDLSAKQKVVSTKLEDEDLISYYQLGDYCVLNLFPIRQGRLLDQENFLLTNIKGSSLAEIYQAFLTQHYTLEQNLPPQIYLPLELKNSNLAEEFSFWPTRFKFAGRGKKAQLLKLGSENAKEYLEQQISKETSQKLADLEALKQLQQALKIKNYLQRIEAYDVSNIQGTDAVGSMVVFTDGQPEKSQYRRFKIRTVTGANDPAMLAEVVARRFKHPEWTKPDLIILDGGLGQFNTVKKRVNRIGAFVETQHAVSLRKTPIAALAKRQETLYTPKIIQPEKGSPIYYLLQRIRDEAHRFAIGYHRKLKSKQIKKS